MKRVLVLLAVAAITANSLGCCCTRCCCFRNWFYQADYCSPATRVATPVAAVAAPQYQYAPAPSSMMACPAPVCAPACPQPCPQPCAPTYAAAPACGPTCNPPCAPSYAPTYAPTYGLTYASEPACGFSSMGPAMYDTSWSSCEPACGYPSDGEIIMESPGMVYPGPAID